MAGPARADSGSHELSLGAASLTHGAFLRGSYAVQVGEVAYRHSAANEGCWSHVRLGGGLQPSASSGSTWKTGLGLPLPTAFAHLQGRS